MVEEYNPPNNSLSFRDGALSAIYIILGDLVIYGCFVPLLGTYMGGQASYIFNIGPLGELVFVVLITFSLMYAAFCWIGEASYWKHLFAFDKFYSILLQIRDTINVVVFMWCLYGIGHTVVAMVEKDKFMKDQHLSEGAFYVFLKKICEGLYIDTSILSSMGLQPEDLKKNTIAENNRIEHGATYMMFWATITSCVAKLVYFNTLFTYLRAMEIFVSMRPSFEEEDDGCRNLSSSTTFRMPAGPSRIENDFARSMRRSNFET